MISKEILTKYLKQMENEELSSIALSVLKAGNKISSLNFLEKNEKEKNDQYVNHHAITTSSDFISQNIILEYLSSKFPQSFFIVEEKVTRKNLLNRILTSENYRDFISNTNNYIFGIDPLDGTSQYKNDLYEWSISVGGMIGGEHEIGVIYAPNVMNGLLVFGGISKGVYIIEEKNKIKKVSIVEDKEDKKTMIYFGVDIALDPNYNKFVNEVSRNSRTTNVNGSCALGLALVAAGRVDAFIQPTQRVWDWFAGYPLVVESGGRIQFYRFENDKISLIDKPLLEDYNPESRNLGFIAGNKNLVDRLIERLVKMYGE